MITYLCPLHLNIPFYLCNIKHIEICGCDITEHWQNTICCLQTYCQGCFVWNSFKFQHHLFLSGWSSFYPSLTVVHHGIPCYEMQLGDVCLPPNHPDAINCDDSVVFDTFRRYAVYILIFISISQHLLCFYGYTCVEFPAWKITSMRFMVYIILYIYIRF